MTQEEVLVATVREYLRTLGAQSLEELAALMQQTAAEWDACLAGMSEERAALRPSVTEPAVKPWAGEGPGWCAKEVASHYLVTERSLNSVVAGLAGVPSPHSAVAVVSKMGVTSPNYDAMPVPELRQAMAQFFDETAVLIEALRGCKDPEATFPHPVFGPLSAKEWIGFHRVHTMDHIPQIEAIG
jgi:hypothetical protein